MTPTVSCCQLLLKMSSACIPPSLCVWLKFLKLRRLGYIPSSIGTCSELILQKHTVILMSINNWACWCICKQHLPPSVRTHMCLSYCLISRWPSSGGFIRLWSSSRQRSIAKKVSAQISLGKKESRGLELKRSKRTWNCTTKAQYSKNTTMLALNHIMTSDNS